MPDRESRDLDGARYLAGLHALPEDDERPPRAELADDDPPPPFSQRARGERRGGWTLVHPIHRR